MPLLALWTSNPTAVGQFTIEQVVSTAGDGILKDGSLCSTELRDYLSQVPTTKLATYIEHCLTSGFGKGGMVLQDLINELGRRLEYSVLNGRYQGTTNAIGYDGLWISPEGHTVVAEVKTTDAYRISLDTIARYRDKLIGNGQVTGTSSILIIVGREDTGELEAQVRGSRHAWDIRLISADALIKLVQLKESADGPDTGRKIRSLLAPMEYTRLDRMVDVMFTTASDVEAAIVGTDVQAGEESAASSPERAKGVWEFTDSALLQHKREDIISTLARRHGTSLIKKSRALYWNASHNLRVACSISKRYTRPGANPYWYAYHPQWDDFLGGAPEGFFVLGCMDLEVAFSIPWPVLHPLLGHLHTTTAEKGTYWHIHLTEETPDRYALILPKKGKNLPLDEFRVSLGA